MLLFKKRWIFVGVFSFIMLLGSFSMFKSALQRTNIEEMPQSEIETKNNTLISDDFESYANKGQLQAVWQIDEGLECQVNISRKQKQSGLQSIEFIDNNNTDLNGLIRLRRGIGAKYGVLYVSFSVMCLNTTGEWSLYITNTSTGYPNNAVDTGFSQGDTIYYASAGEWTHPRTYTTNTWYHFEVLLDMAKRIYSVYVDNSPLCERVPLFSNLYFVDTIIFRTSAENGQIPAYFYLDDVIVTESTPSPSISENFESYNNNAALGAVWTLDYSPGNTNATLVKDFGHSSSQSVKLVDNNLPQRANISRVFGSKYEYLYLSAWVYPTETNEALGIFLTNTSDPLNHIPAWVGPAVGFNSDGKFLYQSAGTNFLVGTYLANIWYHFEILYDIQSKKYTCYVDDALLCENVPTQVPLISVDRVIFGTSAGGSGSAVFYVDDVTARDWFIKNQANITATKEDNFESYADTTALGTAWTLETYAAAEVTLQSFALKSHSYQKSVRLYDNSITQLCGLTYWFSNPASTVYFRSYVYPLQTTGYLNIRIRNSTGYGTYFFMDETGEFKRGTYNPPLGEVGSGIFYKPNHWYKIELFASNITKTFSVRVNDTWVFQNVPFDYQLAQTGYTNVVFYTSGGIGGGYTFYVDDVFVANQSDSILAGTPLNAFNEKLLVDNDINYQMIQSIDVSGQQTIVADYQYNFSEYMASSVKNITCNFVYSTTAGVTLRTVIRLFNYTDRTWDLILNTTAQGAQSLGGYLSGGVSSYLSSSGILLVRVEETRLDSSSSFDFSLNQLWFRWNLNKVIDILTPENTTYIESTSGYYPGTYGFDNVPNGQDDPAWVDGGASSIASSWYGHNKVYQCPSGQLLSIKNTFSGPQPYGTVEFYMNEEYADQGFQGRLFGQKPADTIVVNWRFYANQFWSTNLSQFIAIGKPLVNNVWYHVRIEFETTSGNYLGLAPWTYRIYLDGEAFGPFKFMENLTPTFLHFYCVVQSNRRTIDAVGYSWDPNYRIGDNLRAGLLLNFTSEITLDWKGYSLDGQPIKPILGIAPIPLNPSGTHALQICANDTIGNLYMSEVRHYTVDVDPPTYTSVMESADPLELDGIEAITIAGVADPVSGVNQVLLEFEGLNHSMSNQGGGTWRYNTWIPSGLGAYPYEIYLQDNLGHWNMTSGAIQVVKAAPPTYSSVMESADPLVLGETETISILGVADFPAGVCQVLLEFEGLNHSMSNQGGGTWSYDTWTPGNLGNFPYSIYLQDNLGHWNGTSGAIDVIDIMPPYSSIFYFPSTETRATSNITVQVADNVAVSRVLLFIDNADFGTQNWTMQFNGVYFWYAYTPATVGIRMVTFYMNDTSGNWNSSQYFINNIYSSLPYSYNFNFPSTETRATSNITLQVADNGAVSHVLLLIDHPDFGTQNRTMRFNGVYYWYTYTPTTISARLVTFYMNDTLGNWNSSQYSFNSIYFSPPTFSDVSYPTIMAVGIVNEIRLTQVMDNTKIGNVFISINGGPNIAMARLSGNTYRYAYSPPAVGEDQNFTISLIDELSNVNTTTWYFVVLLDTEQPTWSNLMAPDGVQNNLITISIKVSDDTSITKVSLYVSGTDFPSSYYIEMNPIGGGFYQYSFVPTISGIKLYSICIEDIARNTVYVMDSFTVASEGGENPQLDFFLTYLLIPVLSAIIVGVLVVIMHLHYRSNLRRQMDALEDTMKKSGLVQPKWVKGDS